MKVVKFILSFSFVSAFASTAFCGGEIALSHNSLNECKHILLGSSNEKPWQLKTTNEKTLALAKLLDIENTYSLELLVIFFTSEFKKHSKFFDLEEYNSPKIDNFIAWIISKNETQIFDIDKIKETLEYQNSYFSGLGHVFLLHTIKKPARRSAEYHNSKLQDLIFLRQLAEKFIVDTIMEDPEEIASTIGYKLSDLCDSSGYSKLAKAFKEITSGHHFEKFCYFIKQIDFHSPISDNPELNSLRVENRKALAKLLLLLTRSYGNQGEYVDLPLPEALKYFSSKPAAITLKTQREIALLKSGDLDSLPQMSLPQISDLKKAKDLSINYLDNPLNIDDLSQLLRDQLHISRSVKQLSDYYVENFQGYQSSMDSIQEHLLSERNFLSERVEQIIDKTQKIPALVKDLKTKVKGISATTEKISKYLSQELGDHESAQTHALRGQAREINDATKTQLQHFEKLLDKLVESSHNLAYSLNMKLLEGGTDDLP